MVSKDLVLFSLVSFVGVVVGRFLYNKSTSLLSKYVWGVFFWLCLAGLGASIGLLILWR